MNAIKHLPDRGRYGRWAFTTPYGVWTLRDGREVLFSRSYNARYSRLPDGPAHRVDPTWFVSNIVDTRYLFDDGTPYTQLRAAVAKVLKDWGLSGLDDNELNGGNK
jgi:hypothetical protein